MLILRWISSFVLFCLGSFCPCPFCFVNNKEICFCQLVLFVSSLFDVHLVVSTKFVLLSSVSSTFIVCCVIRFVDQHFLVITLSVCQHSVFFLYFVLKTGEYIGRVLNDHLVSFLSQCWTIQIQYKYKNFILTFN